MKAFHVNWTKPFFERNKADTYYVEDFEILTMILSALEWQKHNGDIQMVTDEIGARYYEQLGLNSIWNLGIDTSLEYSVDDDIDPSTFWAAGKIFALQKQGTPCVMIDLDFIAWKPIGEKLMDVPLAVIHTEELNKSYPDQTFFKMSENYQFPAEQYWELKPCNTSLTYIADEKFKNFYISQSVHFMKNLISPSDDKSMVFAEQRMFSMCAEMLGIPVKKLVDLENVDMEAKQSFMHIWRNKIGLKGDPFRRKRLCISLINKILNDFPEMEEKLLRIDCLSVYKKQVM